MIYLDTHLVVWLYAREIERLSHRVINLLNENELLISPIILLELQYLFEIHRITHDSTTIVSDLSSRIGIQVCKKPFHNVVQRACKITWTRDPFDRLLVGHAALNDQILLTKDQQILKHYPQAIWD